MSKSIVDRLREFLPVAKQAQIVAGTRKVSGFVQPVFQVNYDARNIRTFATEQTGITSFVLMIPAPGNVFFWTGLYFEASAAPASTINFRDSNTVLNGDYKLQIKTQTFNLTFPTPIVIVSGLNVEGLSGVVTYRFNVFGYEQSAR